MDRYQLLHRALTELKHPWRLAILRACQRRDTSAKMLAAELDAPIPKISYHFREMAKGGLIALVREEPRRGALERFYALTTTGGRLYDELLEP